MPRPRRSSTPPSRRALSWGGGALACALGLSCVFGFRGQLGFADRQPLDGVETVQLHLPPTQLSIIGDGSRTDIDWSGIWSTLGGNSNSALANVERAELVWETFEGIGRLRAELPVDIRDMTVLDELEVESASYLAHEVRGAGDVFVSGVDAYLDIDLEGGSVEVLGGLDEVRVDTVRGNIEVTTGAAADLRTGAGSVTLRSELPAAITVDCAGTVLIELASDSNLALDVGEAGPIEVDLDNARHLGGGSYVRTLGQGSVPVHVRAGGGAVTVRMIVEPEPETETETDTGDTTDTETDTTDGDTTDDGDATDTGGTTGP
ncbi:hypothetical protein PPSIR1_10840 [Plesiocystis pacifica SIR-1]|uniref:Adhesin domain-containing protein n=1 Tax=Plesiocystis pacifica SIR-1 TaxID=391625 RepID=A6G502_9BACT|nr:hypothetical protein [Plesiocystis pacifica]EDM79094.1 hypothetical protein PPSIR1_10840 [Plesiocystis pacifica SIR-1]